MKGPYERLKYDLRRLWECPVCKRRERTAGSVAFRHCSCQMKQLEGKPVVMKLIEDGIQRLTPAVAIQHASQEPAPQEVSLDQVVANTIKESPDLRDAADSSGG